MNPGGIIHIQVIVREIHSDDSMCVVFHVVPSWSPSEGCLVAW